MNTQQWYREAVDLRLTGARKERHRSDEVYARQTSDGDVGTTACGVINANTGILGKRWWLLHRRDASGGCRAGSQASNGRGLTWTMLSGHHD